MASNQEKIINHYSGYNEDTRAKESRSASLEFHYTKKFLTEYITSESRVIELGCATGYYGTFFANKCAEYTGVDLSPENIAIFNEKITTEGITNIRTAIGDATDLSGFSDNSFDIVLCLGPMYHLPQEERLKVFDECYKIAKSGAMLAFAYINRLGAYVGACVQDNQRDKYPNAETNKYVFEFNTTDEPPPGVFFLTSPEEMEYDAKQKRLGIIKNCGLDFFLAQDAINTMNDEQFRCYMEIADKMCESPSCTGLSNHALLICTK